MIFQTDCIYCRLKINKSAWFRQKLSQALSFFSCFAMGPLLYNVRNEIKVHIAQKSTAGAQTRCACFGRVIELAGPLSYDMIRKDAAAAESAAHLRRCWLRGIEHLRLTRERRYDHHFSYIRLHPGQYPGAERRPATDCPTGGARPEAEHLCGQTVREGF